MSFEETTDLADLCEYDEYDSYNEKTFQTTSSGFTEHGIPLSVELSESLCASQTPVNEPSSNFSVRAPEIFLRFDSTNTSVTDFKTFVPHVSIQNAENNVSKESETFPFNPEESNDVNICDDCVELQYENEFENLSNDIDDCSGEIIHKRRSNSLENDYEELLSEGIL